ncbi:MULTISPECIES: hypothetical protein [unclassified Leptolyngbya]|uniref:hypothetical protein n=1 Tax=unclassified Leptolyngbya TaxID=2650499 RepID=UPI001683435D|nr:MULTISPECIES: hypothetical protein [unclassified Leptolyngbya]MBD1913459.1 hypothetical protein [Leptolyngbya sp. FACHB-8]MBD2156322.1 hypothetical protein [Leptolyngbya sp. FACHB-16]
MGHLQRIQQVAASWLPEKVTTASRSELTTFQLHSYGQENSGLSGAEIQPIMEWVSLSIYKSGCAGVSHLFWVLPQDDLRQKLQRLYRNGHIILGYRCGDRMAPPPNGFYWRMVTQHKSTRIYQLKVKDN